MGRLNRPSALDAMRADFLARLDATVPGVGITIGINERYCVGTRIYAGGAHSRNISGGTCPGSTAQLDVSRIAELPQGAVAPALEAQIGRLAFSRTNLRHMQRTRRPLPHLLRLLRQAYRQLTPEQRKQLDVEGACAALSPGAWKDLHGHPSPCQKGA